MPKRFLFLLFNSCKISCVGVGTPTPRGSCKTKSSCVGVLQRAPPHHARARWTTVLLLSPQACPRVFFGKRFLHHWASEQRSRRATTGKRLVWASRIFFVFMRILYIYRNRSFFCEKQYTPFSVKQIYPIFCEKIYPTLTHSLYSLYLLYSRYSFYEPTGSHMGQGLAHRRLGPGPRGARRGARGGAPALHFAQRVPAL